MREQVTEQKVQAFTGGSFSKGDVTSLASTLQQERGSQFDVIIVGGGPAGLSAALILGRSRRRVLLCDTGNVRNASSPAAHNLFTRDGILPAHLLQIGREQLRPYPNIVFRPIEATDASLGEDGVVVTLADGVQVFARKLLMATGIKDELPAIEGFAQLWGKGVFHCPFCDGWEVRDQPLAIYGNDDDAAGLAVLLTNWSRDLVLCSDGPAQLSQKMRHLLLHLGISLREEPIARLEGGNPHQAEVSEGKADRLERIVFTNGEILSRRGLFIHPGHHQHSALPAKLGCQVTENGTVAVDQTGWTGIAHVYMAGDAAGQGQQVIFSVNSGVQVAMAIQQELFREDILRQVLSKV